MDFLFEQFAFKLRNIKSEFKRSLYGTIDWSRNPVVIHGARGTGKTYLALQYVKYSLKFSPSVLYISADHIYFSQYSLKEFAEDFAKNGGTYLIIDDIHKYPEGVKAAEHVLKKFDNLHLVLIGQFSDIFTENEYMAQNAAIYQLPYLSLREFLVAKGATEFPPISPDDILNHAFEIASEITLVSDPVSFLDAYYRYGCYPFFIENRIEFIDILLVSINRFLESDLTYAKSVDVKNLSKIRQLLWMIISPDNEKLNISGISEQIGVTRGTLLQYLDYLKQGGIINLLKTDDKGDSIMTKPDKIFPANPNIAVALGNGENNKCFLDKTFLMSQFVAHNQIFYHSDADFEYSGILFETISKNDINIRNVDNKSIIHAADRLEIGVNNKLPLWIFGFMY